MSDENPIAVFAPCGCCYRWHPDGYWYCALTASGGGHHDVNYFRALNANPGRARSMVVAGMAMAKMGVGRA